MGQLASWVTTMILGFVSAWDTMGMKRVAANASHNLIRGFIREVRMDIRPSAMQNLAPSGAQRFTPILTHAWNESLARLPLRADLPG
jgi:hypothetical protein